MYDVVEKDMRDIPSILGTIRYDNYTLVCVFRCVHVCVYLYLLDSVDLSICLSIHLPIYLHVHRDTDVDLSTCT